ncbi:hypothetical protein DL768_008909 [Monosporascus sp. mg162]|nr:hypothetical protein DL768_008909 [Monosporascus sp. mg162]
MFDSIPKAHNDNHEHIPRNRSRKNVWWYAALALLWGVRRSTVVITEKDGSSWEQKVGELPPNVEEFTACGSLEKWVKSEIEA